MESLTPLCLFFLLLSLLSHSHARKLFVGGRDGWVLNPSENYNQWAGRNRFLVNDVLVFKYQKGSDSVLEVNKEDFDKCNTKNPIKKFEDGDTEFTFDRSGPFYFVSGKDGNCEKGQKLTVVVLSMRSLPPYKPSPTPHKAPSPGGTVPVSPFPTTPSGSPMTPSPSGNSPSTSPYPPSLAPVGSPMTPSPPTSQAPANAPGHPSPGGSSPSTSPYPPSQAPGGSTTIPSPGSSPPATSHAPANAPGYPSPVGNSPSMTPYPPSLAPGGSPTVLSPMSSPPAGLSAPTISPSATSPATSPSISSSPLTSPPLPSATSPAASTSPASPPLASPPTPGTPGSPLSPAPSPGGSASRSASNETAPSPKSSAWAVAPSNLLVYVAAIMVGAALT